MSNIFVQAWTTIEVDLDAAGKVVDADIQKVEAVLGADFHEAGVTIGSTIKQNLATAVGAVAAGEATIEPALVTGITGALDAGLDTLLSAVPGGPALEVPLNQMSNNAANSLAAKAQAAVQAWLLSTQAKLAGNNPPAAAAA